MKKQKLYSRFAEENPGFLVLRNENGFYKAWGESAVVLSKVMGTFISNVTFNRLETGICDFARVERALKALNISFLLIENGEITVRYEGQDPFSMPDERFLVPSVEATPVLLRDESNVCVVLEYCTKTQRECILLRYRSRLSYKEISEKYHCSKQSVQNAVSTEIGKKKRLSVYGLYPGEEG